MPHLCGAKFEGPRIVRNCRAKAALNLDGPTLSVLGGWLELQPVPRRARDMPADPVARHIFLEKNSVTQLGCGSTAAICAALLGRSLVCDLKVAREMT